MRDKGPARGFTLVEVLIAMAITSLVALIAFSGLSAAVSGAESLLGAASRSHNVQQTLGLLSRDLRQVVNRPVVDEFGQLSPALSGGELARTMLTVTRAGWHNSTGAPRSALQRVQWWLEEGTLWRGYFPVLDRAPGTEAIETPVLEEVTRFEVRFLSSLDLLDSDRNDVIDRRDWQDNWIADLSQPDLLPAPPVAVEVVLNIASLGEIRRTYVLPSG